MERWKYLLSRFGMLIPFVLTVIFLIVSKSVAEPYASRLMIVTYVFAGTFAAWLVSWVVRVLIKFFQTKKEIEEADKK